MKDKSEVIAWLEQGDPAIRWQTLRDFSLSGEEELDRERQRVATEGWGARLLSFQDEEGSWAKKLYSPKWVSTTYTMLLLKRMGLPTDNEQAHKGCKFLLDNGFHSDGGIIISPKSTNHSETCVTGMVLSILAYFLYDDQRVYELVKHLLKQQMVDGGWNCRSYEGDTHSSFHTTINVLEGLWEYEKKYRQMLDEVEEVQEKARQFLLEHKLYKSHRTGEVVDKRMTRFSFPPRWYYDIMRVLDYFQSCDVDPDDRAKDAIKVLMKKQRKDGTWPLQDNHPGRTYFDMEQTGKPSRWNTMRALRIIDWWNQE
jgi:hypothetical protein